MVSEKSLGFGFGKFGIVKKVSVSVKILVSSFSAQDVKVRNMVKDMTVKVVIVTWC